jgi:hypothetical protein
VRTMFVFDCDRDSEFETTWLKMALRWLGVVVTLVPGERQISLGRSVQPDPEEGC